MVVIKKIGILSLAKLETILMAIFGLLLGIFYAILAAVIGTGETLTDITLIQFGWLSIIIFPVIYAILGFVTGIIGGWLYNVIAGWVGGIELELSK